MSENHAPVARVLVVDDEPNIRQSVQMVLSARGFAVELAEDGIAADLILNESVPDAILLDVRLPGRNGLELLKYWRVQHPTVPVVLMSGDATITEALEGLKMGAYDFIEKPFLAPKLVNTITRAIEKSDLQRRTTHADIDPMVGQSERIKSVIETVAKIAPTKSRVLITGESGTGKELIARAIHEQSDRRARPFIKVNCAAIPHELVESHLFGHTKGSFTGAVAARRGLFEQANGGSIFLDEIGELSLAAQAKMLRVLQNSEISPVGSEKTLRVDVRVIAATNRDLKVEVENGQFREDLYYRLNVVEIASPSLRERVGDIEVLCDFFLRKISLEYGFADKELSQPALERMKSYSWPGNIRELRNVIERLVLLSGPIIQLQDLPREILGDDKPPVDLQQSEEILPWEEFKVVSERQYLIRVLKSCEGNISEAARLLKVERSTIHKWFKSLQIEKHHYVV